MRHNLEAPVIFKPTPPAFELSRKRTVEKSSDIRRQDSITSTYSGCTEMTY
jgi:hypothetical protein